MVTQVPSLDVGRKVCWLLWTDSGFLGRDGSRFDRLSFYDNPEHPKVSRFTTVEAAKSTGVDGMIVKATQETVFEVVDGY
jgi:hypothetical protein